MRETRRATIVWWVGAATTVGLVVLLLSVTGCRGADGGDSGGGDASVPATVTVTAADAGSTQQLVTGQGFAVELEGNPTTGYDWVVEGSLPAQLNQVGATQFDPESTALGAPGTVHIDYVAAAQGRGQLTLGYLRPFEKGQAATKTFAIEVEVRAP